MTSRPRRFGKSLMITTFKYIFEGRRELFKGLKIDGTDYDWKVHPAYLWWPFGLRMSASWCILYT